MTPRRSRRKRDTALSRDREATRSFVKPGQIISYPTQGAHTIVKPSRPSRLKNSQHPSCAYFDWPVTDPFADVRKMSRHSSATCASIVHSKGRPAHALGVAERAVHRVGTPLRARARLGGTNGRSSGCECCAFTFAWAIRWAVFPRQWDTVAPPDPVQRSTQLSTCSIPRSPLACGTPWRFEPRCSAMSSTVPHARATAAQAVQSLSIRAERCYCQSACSEKVRMPSTSATISAASCGHRKSRASICSRMHRACGH